MTPPEEWGLVSLSPGKQCHPQKTAFHSTPPQPWALLFFPTSLCHAPWALEVVIHMSTVVLLWQGRNLSGYHSLLQKASSSTDLWRQTQLFRKRADRFAYHVCSCRFTRPAIVASLLGPITFPFVGGCFINSLSCFPPCLSSHFC